MRRVTFKRYLYTAMALVAVCSFVLQPTAAAISRNALENILKGTPQYGLDEDQPGCAPASVAIDGGNASGKVAPDQLEVQLNFVWAELNNEFPASLPILTGSDLRQQGFNYFISKGLTEIESAAIIGNFMQESGMNPKSDQASGPGRGIAQWSEGDRWDDLLKYVEFLKAPEGSSEAKKLKEAAVAALGDESAGLAALKDNKNNVDAATDAFQRAYERAGTPETEKRQQYAREVLQDFGSTGGSSVGGTSVAGSSASCSSVGAVNCDGVGSSQLSRVRQDVVCLAEAENAKWESGEMKRGTDFFKYSQGRDEEWCADFVSWIYNQAKYPIDENTKDGNVPAVDSIKAKGDAGIRFEYHAKAGYTPVPGDIIYYKESWSHVNIVVSVNTATKTVGAVGGNQSGVGTANTSSAVTKYETLSWTDDQITGYVSPKD